MAAPISGLVSYSDSNSDVSSSDESSHEDSKTSKRKRAHSSSDESSAEISSVSSKCARGETNAKERLPVPDGIANMFSEKPQHTDNPAEHGGRIRTFEHERGNWASFVYADVEPDSRLFELAHSLVKCLRLCGEFTVQKDLHLSLSRTFVVRHHWIDSLVTSLCSNLEHHRGCTCMLNTPWIYSNDEKTRTFLGINVTTNIKCLKSYVEDIDKSLAEFRLPVYYKDPSFHISLAWAVGDLQDKITSDMMEVLQMLIDEFFTDNPTENELDIKNLKLKTGNKIFYIPLAKT